MNRHTITYLPVFSENPGNPARCEVATGRIEINRQMWDVLSDRQREYVIEHEKGHYYRQTFNELEADKYALELLALKKKNSLWNYVQSVRSISHGDRRRCRAAEKGALEIAANNGSSQARELLMNGYANADGSKDYFVSQMGIDSIEYPLDIKIEWWQFAWALLIVITLSIIFAKLM